VLWKLKVSRICVAQLVSQLAIVEIILLYLLLFHAALLESESHVDGLSSPWP